MEIFKVEEQLIKIYFDYIYVLFGSESMVIACR